MKTCSKCKILKTYDCFDKAPITANRDGRRSRCKECRKADRPKHYDSARAYTAANPIRTKATKLTRFWPGSTWEEAWNNYTKLLEAQYHKCAICSNSETTIDPKTKQPKSLAVDHCHKTGRVRGLLCDKCNRAIGLLKENIDSFNNAISYLINS